MSYPIAAHLLDDSINTVNDLVLMVLDGVALAEALGAGDFQEARFRCQAIESSAWSHNLSKVGNPAINLACALRGAEAHPGRTFESELGDLLRAIELAGRPLRD